MSRATELARAARLGTPPNPWVGCVLAADGEVVGEGATGPYPVGPHAEVAALRAAGDRAQGATAYVTLEPCSHHGNTPPCADALVDAGVARVVIAIEDPDPRVRGTGVERLRAAGIEVETGVAADEVAGDLAPVPPPARHRPRVRAAEDRDEHRRPDRRSRRDVAVDHRRGSPGRRAPHPGRVAGRRRGSRHRSCRSAAPDRPRVRDRRHAAAVAGDARRPRPRTRRRATVRHRAAPTLVVTTEHAPAERVDAWQAAGAKVEVVAPGLDGRGVDLAALLTLLAQSHGVLQAMIEGGGHLHGAFVAEGLADRLVAYVAPVLLGTRGLPAVGFPGPDTIADAHRWRVADVTRLGTDVRITMDPVREGSV